MSSGRDKISMIVFSGTEDRLIPVGVISQAATALGYEVNIFFTGWAMFKLLKNPTPPVWPKEFEQFVPRLQEGMARIKARRGWTCSGRLRRWVLRSMYAQ
ncbi:DsrE/DsrF/DrsH-like family protein [Vulcanisaeta distributa]|uniref:DsrE/DsrF/DrsH-like family protein n=1 Tax=Vulcanisaeta distributa TaxID=164451 RepID=UPI001FB35DE2|nr:DsrE/DsrF/DrsH-like family protein [Vulcanisaeta distributa]